MATQSISPFSAFAATTAPNTQKSSAAAQVGGTAPDQQMFLQLLVAQIKNQDPLNPTDSTQFVAQLAQFSDLEQTIAIRQNTDSITKTMTALTSGGIAGTDGSSGSGDGSSGSPTPYGSTPVGN